MRAVSCSASRAERELYAALVGPDGVLDSVFVSVFFGVSVGVADELDPESSFFVLGFADEYRSEYQPPPLRMKVPPLICRLALMFLQCGHDSTGGSEIF
jgi:hypothetical protein